MKKNVQDMIEGKTLKRWGEQVGVVSTLVVGDSSLHILLKEVSLVDLGEASLVVVVVDLVEDFLAGLNSTFDFSEEWDPLPVKGSKVRKSGCFIEKPKTPL